MNKLHFLTRRAQFKIKLLNTPVQATQKVHWSSSSSSSNSSSSSDDENKSQKQQHEKIKSNEALEKLNQLLKTMIEEDVTTTKTKLNLAKPMRKHQKTDVAKAESLKSSETDLSDKQVVKVVKNVAESLGGDVKQTESELLVKLLNVRSDDKISTLSDLVKGMKIDHESAGEKTKAQQVRQTLQKGVMGTKPSTESHRQRTSRQQKPEGVIEQIDLFGSKPLGIFSNKESNATEGVENKIWNKLYERDLKLAITHPPNNYFQQMILWTEQGKVWRFPIDNEQGLEEEKKVYFTEHVFLERHLEPWCPPKGPLRHFMELVCVGLSKNPYLTVEAKKEHIEWFRKYFGDKIQLLKDTGLIQDSDVGSTQDSQKKIEH